MKTQKSLMMAVVMMVVAMFVGNVTAADYPVFSLAWSEYPSWSTFGVCEMVKFKEVNGQWIIDPKGDFLLCGEKGEMGLIEKKWGVDIVLLEKDYDTCISYYATAQCDAVCATNIDLLPIASSRHTVITMPTSTSYGADAAITSKSISDVSQLKGKKIFGLDKSVSKLCWKRNLQILGQRESDYNYVNNDPGAAAVAFQQGNPEYSCIVVWNPFVMQTLVTRTDSWTLFSSESIPGEIIDCIGMASDSVKKTGGKEAACAFADAFYNLNKAFSNPKNQDKLLVALGKKFSNLNAEQMSDCVRKTRFYSTPEQGISLFDGGVVFPWKKEVKNTSNLFTNNGFNAKSKEVTSKTLKDIMPVVVDFCLGEDMIQKAPIISYGESDGTTQLLFDSQYMKMVQQKNN